MDKVIQRIKDNVLIMDSSIVDDELLDVTVKEIVDRALIYTNRTQLINDYDEDDDQYMYPVPLVLEKPLSRVIVDMYKAGEDSYKEVKSMSDHGQAITFGENMEHYLFSKDDAEVFIGIKPLLDKFRIPTIVETT